MEKSQDESQKSFEVVGIGNAIVDVLVKTDDDFLNRLSLNKGSMKLITEKEAHDLYQIIDSGIESSGGSAANTIVSIAQLGGCSAFIGRTKDDQLGEIFTHDIRSAGSIFHTPPVKNGPSTARCLILVTPDAQRTMCTYLGASVLLDPNDLDLSMVKKTKILYLEGYLWDNPEAKKAFISAAKACKSNGGEIALSLSDSFCVERHRESFLDLINNEVDILFANESEIIELYQCNSIDVAVEKAKNACKINAITLGEKGSIIVNEDKIIKVDSYNLGSVIDTTGAGDLYAGGFLYGYTKGETLEKSGRIGSICAGHIVTQIGSRSQENLKEIISINLN